jgi:DNA-binding beta-propeller fold protein YncE
MSMVQNRRRFLAAAGALVGTRARADTLPRITTLVGTGQAGMAADGEPVATAMLNNPFGVLIGPDKALYWAEFAGHRILKLDFTSRRISIIAGTGEKGHAGDGGPATKALLNAPHEVRFDRAGNMFIAERDSNVVRHVDMRTGLITTIAGTGVRGFSGDGGPATAAQLAQPHSIALDGRDNLYICDILNNRIRLRNPDTGIITTFAGTGQAVDAPDAAALDNTPLWAPRSIDIAPDGIFYLVLREGNKVYAIDPVRRTLQRVAGTGKTGYGGDGAAARDATFNGPKGVAYHASQHALFIADTENHVIRRVDLTSRTIATVAGTGKRGDGPDGDPLACSLNRPHGVFAQGSTLYIGDAENNRIRVLSIA